MCDPILTYHLKKTNFSRETIHFSGATLARIVFRIHNFDADC